MDTPSFPANSPQSAWAEDAFTSLDAVGQAELVRTGKVSPLELVDAAISRIERLNPLVNAVASIDFELARKRARTIEHTGPLAGVPTLVKDLLPYPGLPCEYGSRAFLGQVAAAGSEYTEALDAAGLIVLGKSTTSELGLLGTTETLARGATRNPWDLSRSAGGSSGGAVAAVASGMVPIAHASDGGGSIRGPAALCGLFGFKPSRGRNRSTGAASDGPFGRLLSDHCVSRSVRDSASWLAVTQRQDADAPFSRVGTVEGPLAKRLRIGVYEKTSFGHAPEPEVQAALLETAKLCQGLGHEIVECSGPQFDAPSTSNAFFSLAGAMVAGLFAQLRHVFPAFDTGLFEPFTRALAERIGDDPMAVMQRAMSACDEAATAANRSFADVDVLLCPTVPFAAYPLGRIGPTMPVADIIVFTEKLAGYTAIASFAGWCAMSVPLHVSSVGLPIGMHFAAPAGQDATLLALALALESASPWAQRRPGNILGAARGATA
jgi:amidase